MVDIKELFTPFPVLESERLILRRLFDSDAEDIFEYASDPEITKYVTWEYHKSIDDTHTWLKTSLAQYENIEHSFNWGIILKQTNKLLGTIGLYNLNETHSKVEMGYVMSKLSWNKGYTTEAVCAVLKFAFENMNLNRIFAQCEPANTGSARVLEKAGMTFEGILRNNMFLKGSYRDHKVYSILRKEYPVRD